MKTCPNCATSNYSTFANGAYEVGYCQHCSFESKEKSTRNDSVRVELSVRHRAPEEKSEKPVKKDKKW